MKIHFFVIAILLMSCKNNAFDVVSNQNDILLSGEISKLGLTQEAIDYYKRLALSNSRERNRIDNIQYYQSYKSVTNKKAPSIIGSYTPLAEKIVSKAAATKSTATEDLVWKMLVWKMLEEEALKLKTESKQERCERLKLVTERLKLDSIKAFENLVKIIGIPIGLQSQLVIKNNSNQIIETSILIIMVSFQFETNRTLKFVKQFSLLENNKIWKKDSVLELNLNLIPSFALNYKRKIFEVHTPTNVMIDYYLIAKNSIGYCNVKGLTKVVAPVTIKSLGQFISKQITNEERMNFGEKIFSFDATSLWNDEI